jgi:DNA adenine methylase
MIGGREQDGNFKNDARFNRNELIRKIRKIASLSNRIDLYNLDAADFISNDVLDRYYKVFINFDPPYVDKGGQSIIQFSGNTATSTLHIEV